jgi:succinate-semialdehyde dehydrogenase/glutarate-semialdehyde dehydrogenase
MSIKVINPSTGLEMKSYQGQNPKQIEEIIEYSHNSFLSWRETSFSERSELMQSVSRILRENIYSLAELMAMEMGKPIREGWAEIEKCARVCEYYAENAGKFIGPETVETDAACSYVSFQPLGPILAVMPWNFPFWQVFRFAAPALMAGNTGILKHASNVPGCALAIQDIFDQAGFPKNVFSTLLITGDQVESVIEHPLIQAVTLTGSTPAGQAVAAKAGSLIKKTVLELGGSDPYIVLADADLAETVETCVASRLINAGQSCIAAKRFIVAGKIRKKFETLITRKMKSKKMGNPLNENTSLGPLARFDLRDELHQQVKKSIKMGATCLLGGEIPRMNGAFYPPTVLTGVKKGMPAYDEELFGPVAAIIPVKNLSEAVQVANDSVFGLGAAIFTRDIETGKKVAEKEIQAGNCFVNAFVRSDPRLPFGGIKQSGYGRELSHFGIREFVNIKTVYIK